MSISLPKFTGPFAAALIAASMAFVSACNYAPAPNGAYDAVNAGDGLPAISLIDQHGNHISLASLRGKPVLVDFIYTSCPGPCSTLTSKLVTVAEDLGPKLGSQVQMISISLDPEHDSPARLKQYAQRLDAERSGWLFLTGTPQQVEQVLAAYNLRRLRESDGSVTHMETMFLLGADGRQRRIYNGVEVKPALMSVEAENLAGRG
ncbi:MAG TPA: SCO family protein [Candidatus Binataceae bacterium]|nr:SCO family protein [Candidatus Binataceae bacterium]